MITCYKICWSKENHVLCTSINSLQIKHKNMSYRTLTSCTNCHFNEVIMCDMWSVSIGINLLVYIFLKMASYRWYWHLWYCIVHSCLLVTGSIGLIEFEHSLVNIHKSFEYLIVDLKMHIQCILCKHIHYVIL